MTNIDIFSIAHLPKLDMANISDTIYNAHTTPIQTSTNHLATLYAQLSAILPAYKHLRIYGYIDTSEEFNTALESLNCVLSPQIEKSLEQLAAIVQQVWAAIKTAIQKLITYLQTDAYFSQWFNKNENYCRKVSTLIATVEHKYALADLASFFSTIVVGYPVNTYEIKLQLLIRLVAKLNNSTTYNLSLVDILTQFNNELIGLGFTIEQNNKLCAPENMLIRNKTLYDLKWTPQRVHSCTNLLYRQLLCSHLKIDKLKVALLAELSDANNICQRILAGTLDDTNSELLNSMKLKIANIQNIQLITNYCIRLTEILSFQWISMVNAYNIK